MQAEIMTRMTADTRKFVEQMQSRSSLSSEDNFVQSIRGEYQQIIPLAGNVEAVSSVEDYEIPVVAPAIRLRLYHPKAHNSNLPLPALIFFHGGGFVSGNFETHDRPLRAVANMSHCVVVAVEYRLAPEFTFPTAPEDCFIALQWITERAERLQIDVDKIAIGGDSAGGLLATTVCLMCRDRNQRQPLAQILIYPNTDLSIETASWYELDFLHPSHSRIGFLKQVALYLPDADARSQPYASPLQASDLSQLAPALIITAELDAQRDEGEAYAQRLRESGCLVTHTRYPGVIHGFFQLGGVIASGRVAINEVSSFLRLRFNNLKNAA